MRQALEFLLVTAVIAIHFAVIQMVWTLIRATTVPPLEVVILVCGMLWFVVSNKLFAMLADRIDNWRD